MDDAEPSAGKTAGEVVAFSAKLSMNVQSEGAGRSRQEGLHESCCLSVRSFQWTTVKPAASMTAAQPVGGGQVAQLGPVGPWERVVEAARCARGDVPDSEAASGDEHPTSLLIEAGLVGHVHLDVLADDRVEAGLAKGSSVTSP